jgi:type I restriction enzyme S subunit
LKNVNRNMDLDKRSMKHPRGWAYTELGNLLKIRSGYAFRSKDYIDDGVLLIRQANLGSNNISIENAVYLPPEYLDQYHQYRVQKGDVLLGMSGSIGKLCEYSLGAPALQNQRTGLLVFFAEDTKRFILYYLSILRNLLLSKGKGVGVQNISSADIESFVVPLPPLPEQHRIVAKIEELFTKLDAGIEALNKMKAQLKRYRQAVLKYAFEGKLTEKWREEHKNELEPAAVLLERIKEEFKRKGKYKEMQPVDTTDLPELPEGWMWIPLGEIHLDLSKSVDPKKRAETVFELYSVPSFEKNRPEILRGKEVGSNKRIVEENTVLLCKINPRINRVWIVGNFSDFTKISSTEWIPFSLLKEVNPQYLSYFMQRGNFRSYLSLNVSGVGGSLMRIKSSTFGNYPFPLSSIQEQVEIVEKIVNRFSLADEVEKIVDVSLKQSERLRQSILKKAFEGKLVPQDPTDEPAEKLLERIKAEKAKREAEEKTKRKGKGGKLFKQRRLM